MKFSKRLLSMCLSLLMLLSVLPGVNTLFAAATVSSVVVSQAGYSANDVKLAYALSDVSVTDTAYQVLNGSTEVASGQMKDEGIVWGKHVYLIDFSSVTDIGTNYKIRTNGVSSFTFPIQTNNWADYRMDFMTYYRMQRAGTDTAALMSQGSYSTLAGNPLIAKGLHPASHMDDAWDETKTKHYDLTGGWYDAGDFGVYSENQWVTGQMALTYLDNINATGPNEVDFDLDGNGIPDILDEVIFSAEYALKMVDAFGGYGYNIMKYSNTGADDKGGWKHPEKYTDGIIDSPAGAKDDRYAYDTSKSVEGSAKLAGTLAAAARALEAALTAGKITQEQLDDYKYDQKNVGVNNGSIDNYGSMLPGHEADVPALEDFIQACRERALAAYNTAYAYDKQSTYPKSNYLATEGLTDPLLWAETELYLLDPANNSSYLDRAKTRIDSLTFNDIRCTSYWGLSSLAMQELYPAIETSDVTLAGKIRSLLESRVNYFLSSANDTPYGVLNEFSNFGVNEPHISYVADTLRYYKLFKDVNPTLANKAIKAVKKGLYWVFGDNPWNTSWVSGIGTKYTKFLHSRLDEDAQSVAIGSQQGFILPGAMVCGPNMYSPLDKNSANPWYQDVEVAADGANQWRFNEHSISIQIGLFYSVMSLSTMTDNPAAEADIQDTVILSPKTGDKVVKGPDNTVKLVAKPMEGSIQEVAYSVGTETGAYTPMTLQSDGTYTADVDISTANPLSSKRVIVRSTLTDGTVTYTTTSFVVAASYPSYQQDVLIDDFNGNGLYAAGWVCWWSNPLGSDGQTSKADPGGEDGKKRLILTQNTPKSSTNEAQFRNDSAFPDLTGYQYLYVTLRNAGTNPNTQVRIAFDNKFSPWVTYASSSDYTTVQVDMNALFGSGNPHKTLSQFNIQVRPNSDPAAPIEPTRIYVKDIKAGNQGTPPSFNFSNNSVDKTTGDEDTLFNFKTTLTINQAIDPSGVQIVIDGAGHNMVQLNSADTNFTDGKDYIYSTLLDRGSHSYYFRTNDSGDPEKTGPEVTAAATPPTAPKPAANVRITAVSGRNIILVWDDAQNNPNLAGYNVYMNGTKLNSSPLTVNTIPVGNLNGGVNYNFVVKGVDASDNESAASATLAYTVAPARMRYEGESVKTAVNERKTDSIGQASGGYGKVYSSNKAVFNVRIAEAGTYNYTLNFLDKGTEKFDIILDEATLNQTLKSVDTTSVPNNAWVNANGTITVASAGTHTITVKNNQTYTGAQWWNLCIDYLDVYGTAPNDISNMAPADNASAVPTAANLTWDCDQAASYYVAISPNADMSDPIKTGTVTSPAYQYSGLENLTKYYWQVTASNPNADSKSAVLSFTTSAAAAPGTFNLTSPASSAVNVSNTPSLTWEASSDATDYTVVISASSDMSNPVVTAATAANAYQPSALAYGTTYYWKVTANNAFGNTDAANNGISFKTKGAPVRFYGKFANNANERKNATDWPGNATSTPDGWAKKYQGSGEINWSVNFPTAGVYDFAARIANDGGSSPTFKVRVDGVAVTSDFNATSGTWKDFTGSLGAITAGTHTIGVYNSSTISNTNIDIAHMDIYGVAPGNFTLKSPSNGAALQPANPTLNWMQSVGSLTYPPYGANSYNVLVAKDIGFSNVVMNTTVTGTTYQPGGLDPNTTYYWKVIAHNSNGDTASGSSFSFATAPVPSAFSLSGPANNAADQEVSLDLSWGTSANATNYTLVVADNSGFNTPVINTTITGTSYQVLGLAYGTTYYWKVTANSASASTPASNNGCSFTTKPAGAYKPGSFTLNSLTQPIPPALTLSWGASADAASYALVVSTNSDLSSPVFSQNVGNVTSYLLTLTGGTTYYWKVTAQNTNGNTEASNNSASFMVSYPARFAAVSATGDVDERHANNDNSKDAAGVTAAQSIPNHPVGWIKINRDTASKFVSIPVYFPVAGNYPFTLRALNNKDSVSKIGVTLVSGGTPAIITTTKGADQSWSDYSGILTVAAAGVQSVKIYCSDISLFNPRVAHIDIYGAMPAPFTLTSPSNGAANQASNPTLSWLQTSASPNVQTYGPQGAVDYTIIVADNSSFTNPIVNTTVTGTSYQPSGLANGITYYWKVLANNPNGSQQSTSYFSFTTILPAPGAFTLVEPSNNAAGQPLNPTLSWNPSSDAAGYTVVVSDDSSFANIIASASISGTSYQVTGLAYVTTYYWKVTASNKTGDTGSDSVFSFTTIQEPSAPGTFRLLTPSDKANDQLINPVLTWEASDLVKRYHVAISTKKDFSEPVVDVIVTGTEYQVPALEANTKYYWKVTAENSVGMTDAANNGIFFMTSKESLAPGEFRLITPQNGGVDQPIIWHTLVWTSSKDAESYTVTVSANADFSNPVFYDTVTNSTCFIPELEYGMTYYWKVVANNESGSTDASNNGISFTTIGKQ